MAEKQMSFAEEVGPEGFAGLVRRELARARRGYSDIQSSHEGYAVILEEVEEYWEEVRKRRAARDPKGMLKELVQISAMAQRTAEDLGLLGGSYTKDPDLSHAAAGPADESVKATLRDGLALFENAMRPPAQGGTTREAALAWFDRARKALG